MQKISLALFLVFLWSNFVLAQQPGSPPPRTASAEAAKVATWLQEAPPISAAESHFGVLGGLHMMNMGEEVLGFIRTNGMAALYSDPQRLQMAQDRLSFRAQEVGAVLTAGGMYFVRDVQNIPWGVVEYEAGSVNYTLTDTAVRAAGEQGVYFVGTVMPYAAWDLTSAAASTDEMCLRLMSQDFFYLTQGGKMDRYQDVDAFIMWLTQTVERYDGDGIDDMEGLTLPVKYWQIHNEPEGDRCGLFRGDTSAFVSLMQRSYTAVKAACPDCQIMNGGAGIPLWQANTRGGEFWEEFAAAGGASYLDIIALHYNNGKSNDSRENYLETQIQTLRTILGENKPVWATEFGTLIKDANAPTNGNVMGFTQLTEIEAAAWYIRYYTVGLANGVERFFSDSVSFFNPREILLPYYVNKLLEAKIGAFSTAEKLAEGQYRFLVNGQAVYILWSGMPVELQGTVTATDMYGNETQSDAGSITPNAANPLIITLP